MALKPAMSSMIFNRPAVDSPVAAFDATSRMARLPDHVLPRCGRAGADLRIALETLRANTYGSL